MKISLRKNASPSNVARLTALVVSTLNFILLLLLKFIANINISFWVVFFFFAIIFLSTYFITLVSIKNFIFRKIKLIYKKISTTKLSDMEKLNFSNNNVDMIAAADEEVDQWLENNNLELKKLKIEEAYRKEYLGNVAHELKTPLFTIQGYVETLIDGALDDPEVNMKYLNKAKKNIRRLNKIVNGLDKINVFESDNFKLEQEVFDINALAKDVIEELEPRGKEFEIKLGIKEGTDYSFMVFGDVGKIQQVLINLIENSLKYGKVGGATVIGFYDMANSILIEVSDDGVGISEEDLPRLFERFYRVEKSRSRDSGGSGLGLAIVKHIIEGHHQSINVRSTLGLGSTFGFTLQKA